MANKDYPLFPELPEAGQTEAQKLIDKFKDQLKRIADDVIGDLYCDVAVHIESDSWMNFRNDLMAGFKNYNNKMVQGEFDFKTVRESILEQHRAELVKDLNQDLLGEIARLKEDCKRLAEMKRF